MHLALRRFVPYASRFRTFTSRAMNSNWGTRRPVAGVRAFCVDTTKNSGATETKDDEPIEVEAEAVDYEKTAADFDIEQEIESMDKAEAKEVDKDEDMPPEQGSRLGELRTQSFQAETKQLLEIVSKSLYTDREIFLRELLSNASDALEKMRYLTQSGSAEQDPNHPLEMTIRTNKTEQTLTIMDSGIGMTAEELTSNLGVIARSGSKNFLKEFGDKKEAEKEEAEVNKGQKQDQMENLIGMFGVGFYSAFMVANKIEVFSQSYKGDQAHYWVSEGAGEYAISPAENVLRGTRIVLHLKDDAKEFCDRFKVEAIVKKYSAYLMFPIKLNRSLITSTGALWATNPKEVDAKQHKEFYQLLSNAYDDPFFIFHSHFENVKYSIQCLFYFPATHSEKLGMGRMDPGCSVYSRKVLIKPKCREILPEWLRFVKGVVDSENIPLHISREELQDSKLIEEINTTLQLKIVDFLKRQAKKEPDDYKKFYEEFNGFIKEGVCIDYKNRRKIAELLRFETNTTPAGTVISFDEYIENMGKDQKDIYYLVAPSRAVAMASPYLEAFEGTDTQVMLGYAQIDDFCFQNLQSYRQKEIVNAEKSSTPASKKDELDSGLTFEESEELIDYIKKEFPKKIDTVTTTDRLKSSPAILIDHMSQAIRFYLRSLGEKQETPPQKMQINPRHPVIKGLQKALATDRTKAKVVTSQLINNAFIAAGLVDDAREMLHDINDLMAHTLGVTPTTRNETVEATPAFDSGVPGGMPEPVNDPGFDADAQRRRNAP